MTFPTLPRPIGPRRVHSLNRVGLAAETRALRMLKRFEAHGLAPATLPPVPQLSVTTPSDPGWSRMINMEQIVLFRTNTIGFPRIF